MPTYALEIEAFGVYTTDIPSLEIWADGVLNSTHSISSTGSTISLVINYAGALPSSLAFTFNDALSEMGRTIEVRSVKINDKYVNIGNYLSSDTLVKSATATVNVVNSSFLFDESEPALSEFTTGATRTTTTGNDFLRIFTSTTDEVFDAQAGQDSIYLGSGNDKVFGNDGDDIIYGGAGNDLLSGGNDNDRLYGGDGNDTLYGGMGNDLLYGEAGDDEIFGGDGNDNLVGHDGNDLLVGGNGNDKLNGGDGDDYLFGDAGDDQITGGNGNDTIDGGSGADLMYGGSGVDHMNGGDDNDIMIGDAGNDVMHGDDGDDLMYGLADNDTMYGGAGLDEIYGGAGNDTIDGGADADTITGGTGADTINGGNGNDTINLANGDFAAGESLTGGGGTDNITLTNATTVNFTTGTLATIETLNGSTGNDIVTISGTQLNGFTTLSFNGGTDTLNITTTSTGFNALADGSLTGLENVSASTAAAGVTISLASQTEGFTITGSGFDDTLTGGSGNDTLTGGNGNDTITGGVGTDTVVYSLAWNYYTISLAGSTYTITHKNGGAQGTDTVTTVENFQFADGTFTTANLLAPVITSNGGGASAAISRAENGTSVTTVTATNPNPGGAALSYSISGGSDAARFTINSSTGVLAFTSAPDYENPLDNGANNVYDVQVRVTDGTHDDIQNISVTVTNVAEADVGNTIGTAGTMTVGSSVLYDVGSSGDRDWYGVNLTGGVTYAIWARGTPTEAASSTDPRIYGVRNASNTVVSTGDDDGGVGYESLLYFTPGSTGTYYIDAGAYGTVTGQILLSVFVGGSTQNGTTGADTLNGSANADYLIGNNGNDILYGNGGSDILEGGNNNDYLDGGLGADVLVGGAGADTFVISTTDASDSIVDFTNSDVDVLDISNILVGWNSATDDIDDYLQFQTSGSDTIVRVDVDGLANGTNFVEIATLEGTTGLVVQTLYDNSQIIA